MSSAAFDPGAFARRYSFLSGIPDRFFDAVVHGRSGDIETRATGLLAWRDALNSGELPSFSTARWPRQQLFDSIRRALASLGLARFCKTNPELTDAVLEELLEIAGIDDDDRDARLRALEALLRQQAPTRRKGKGEAGGASGASRAIAAARSAFASASRAQRTSDEATSGLDPAAQATIDRAVREADGAGADSAAKSLLESWEPRVRLWNELESVFGELGAMTGLGYDLSRQVLKQVGFLEAARLAKLLEQVPKLRELIRTLGRLHDSDSPDSETVLEQVFEPVLRTAEELREVRTPHVPHEMRGVERSDAITRMLPSEAVLLSEPELEWLWHARRAERALVVYRVEGTEFERVSVDRVGTEPKQRPKPKPERGPIIVCVDTSGSMNGLPENVAKAITLEAARTAHREKRRCFLYSFGGPGDVVEHDLTFDAGGIARLLTFLAHSFGGGTDVAAPLARACGRLSGPDWNRADVVLVTDGEFGVADETRRQVEEAKTAHGTRFHGILIGSQGSAAISALCDPVHVFTSWGAMLGE